MEKIVAKPVKAISCGIWRNAGTAMTGVIDCDNPKGLIELGTKRSPGVRRPGEAMEQNQRWTVAAFDDVKREIVARIKIAVRDRAVAGHF